MPNHPIHPVIRQTSQLARRERRQAEAMEVSSALAHRELQLCRDYAQAQILSDTAVAHTAMAAAAGTAAYGQVLRDASPEAAEALRFLEAKHAATMGQRMDEHSQGS